MYLGNQTWIITFGDLLTLLICFAVIQVTQIDIKTSDNQQTIQQVSDENRQAAAQKLAVGKEFADTQLRKLVTQDHSLFFYANDLDSNGFKLNAGGLLRFLAEDYSTVKKIELSFCHYKADSAEYITQQLQNLSGLKNWSLLLGKQACKQLKKNDGAVLAIKFE